MKLYILRLLKKFCFWAYWKSVDMVNAEIVRVYGKQSERAW